MRSSLLSPCLLVALAVSSIACGPSEPPAPACANVPGADDQAALQTLFTDAQPGDTICLGEGTFKLNAELSLDVDDVTVKGAGAGKTILDFSAQDLGANGIQITSNGVTFEDLEVRDTPGDGIRATSVNDIAFRRVKVAWSEPESVENGAYALYPVGCDGVVVEECEITGARDAGVYVGQSRNILVSKNHVYGNVAGIEIENSVDAEVVENDAHDNTAGILVFNLPGLPMQGGSRSKVHHNRIVENNIDNFAEPGTVVADVPPGCGIMVLASDDNEFHDNTIENNVSTGILILSYVPPAFMEDPMDPNFDKYAQGNYMHHNIFTNNGLAPKGQIAFLIPDRPVPDVIWDGCTDPNAAENKTNCIFENGEGDYINADLCNLTPMQSKDTSQVTCEYPSLPSQG